jgi:alginate O-acetyltransferase complex protein AlgI
MEFHKALTVNLYVRHDYGMIAKIGLYSLPVVAYHVRHVIVSRQQPTSRGFLHPLAFGIMLFLIVTNSGTSAEFIYFQF